MVRRTSMTVTVLLQVLQVATVCVLVQSAADRQTVLQLLAVALRLLKVAVLQVSVAWRAYPEMVRRASMTVTVVLQVLQVATVRALVQSAADRQTVLQLLTVALRLLKVAVLQVSVAWRAYPEMVRRASVLVSMLLQLLKAATACVSGR